MKSVSRETSEDPRAALAAELLKGWGLEALREHGGGVQGTVSFALDLAESFYKGVKSRGWEADTAS